MEQNDGNQLFLWHQSGKDKNQVLSLVSNNLLFKLVSRLTLFKFTNKELLWAETIVNPSPDHWLHQKNHQLNEFLRQFIMKIFQFPEANSKLIWNYH